MSYMWAMFGFAMLVAVLGFIAISSNNGVKRTN